MNEVENGFLTHQREPGSSFWGVRVTWWRKEAIIFVTLFLTFPHPPTHVVRVAG